MAAGMVLVLGGVFLVQRIGRKPESAASTDATR
jgi:hypothetical protein